MKKMILVLLLPFLFSGCTMFLVSPAIRVDNAIEKVGARYRITDEASVSVTGDRASAIEDVFRSFGFSVVNRSADYAVKIEVENLGYGYDWGCYAYPAKVRMRVTKNCIDKQFFYSADAEFKFYSGSSSFSRYPSDPYGVAAKIAAAHAIGDFIEEQKISHLSPQPKPTKPKK
jgi:hypothetical protein